MKIYIFFALSIVNIIIFTIFLSRKIVRKTLKHRLFIIYFYLMALPCGDMYYSMKSREIPPDFSIFIFVTIILFLNIIFITKFE